MVGSTSVLDALFFGLFSSALLTGICVSGAWDYFAHNHDGWLLRATVSVSMMLLAASNGSKLALARHFMVEHFGDTVRLHGSDYMAGTTSLLASSVFCVVHLFFASRIWLLTQKPLLSTVIVVLSLAMLVLNAYAAFGGNRALSGSFTLTFHALAMATDIIITISFCLFLNLSSQKVAFSNGTRSVVHRLLNFVVTRGVLMSAFQLAHLVVFALWQDEVLLWMSLHIILDPIDVITMLVILNSRPTSREGHREPDADHPLRFTPSPNPFTCESPPSSPRFPHK